MSQKEFNEQKGVKTKAEKAADKAAKTAAFKLKEKEEEEERARLDNDGLVDSGNSNPLLEVPRNQLSIEELIALNESDKKSLFDEMEEAVLLNTFETLFSDAERTWFQKCTDDDVLRLKEEAKQKASSDAKAKIIKSLAERRDLLAASKTLTHGSRASASASAFPLDSDDEGEGMELGSLSITNRMEDITRGLNRVEDCDGGFIKVAMKQADYDKRKASIAIPSRLCDETQYDILVGTSLDITLLKVKALFTKSSGEADFNRLFGAPKVNQSKDDQSVSNQTRINQDVMRNVRVLEGTSAYKDDKLLSLICGLTVFEEKVLTLGKFRNNNSVDWGGNGFFEIEGAIRNLGIYLSFIFGQHMVELSDLLMTVLSDDNVRFWCNDCPATLVYTIDLVLMNLWIALRGPYFVGNERVSLKDGGWKNLVRSLIDGIDFNAHNIAQLKARLLETESSSVTTTGSKAGAKRGMDYDDKSNQQSPRSASVKKKSTTTSNSTKKKIICVATFARRLGVSSAPDCIHGPNCDFDHELVNIDRRRRTELEGSRAACMSNEVFKRAVMAAFDKKYPKESSAQANDGGGKPSA